MNTATNRSSTETRPVRTRPLEEDMFTAAPSPAPSDDASGRSDCEEAPAVEGLLLLQHVTERESSAVPHPIKNQRMGKERGEDSLEEGRNDARMEMECTAVNPIHELLRKGLPMRAADDVEYYRGVFVHPSLSLYYGIIQAMDRFHFLGFHVSANAAAQAWDLAALKRAMVDAQNLSTAKTNFRLEDYVRLENVLSLMVVLNFEELVEMFRNVNKCAQTSPADLREVFETMKACKTSFEDELGNVPIPAELKTEVPHSEIPAKSFSLDEMHELLSTTCGGRETQNLWVRNIRDSKKWKGVYFSKDGVPYSKVELGGKYQYLGRFETLEDAARAYDLASLKRAMLTKQAHVSLNFPTDDYVNDRQLMELLYASDTDEVGTFIRSLAQNQRACLAGDHYGRGRPASKRQKLDGTPSVAAFNSRGRKPARQSLQHINWDSLELGKNKTFMHPIPPYVPGFKTGAARDSSMDMDEEMSDPSKRQETRVERRICDGNMAALLRDSTDWVRVALNAVALNMTRTNITVSTEHAYLPGDVAEWFGALKSDVEGPHAVELTNACGKQSFHSICHVGKDHCHLSAMAWNQFVDEIGLTVGDILVLLKSNTLWKLSYAVFVLPDAVVADAFSHPLHRGKRCVPGMSPPMYVSSPASIRPSIPPSMSQTTKRTLQAHILPNALNLTNIRIIQKAKNGKLLVEAGFVVDPATGAAADPSKRQLFVIPANSLQANALPVRPTSGFANCGRPGHPFHPQPAGSRFPYNVQGTVSNASRPQTPTRPACLPSTPIRMNICGGFEALTDKRHTNLYMVTDADGQLRLMTSQALSQYNAGRRPGVRPLKYNSPPEQEPAMAYPSPYFPSNAQRNARPSADRTSRTSPEVTIIDPSTTGSDASGTGTEKPHHQERQEEHSSGKNVIDLVEEDDKETTEKQGDSQSDMYIQIKKIIKDCTGLDSDIAMKYKLAFANKMAQGQQVANYVELKNLSQAGEWDDVAEWIKSTVESFK